ncbi:MAG: hypothetical protein AABZ47_11235 [Planctomycetota bacterium]
MAIRFLCVGCTQPIEIDEQWAAKSVACPYCRRTMTAPAESTLDDLRLVPVATPLGNPATAVLRDAAFPITTPLVSVEANRIAVVALVLACMAAGFALLAMIVLSPHALELTEMQKSSADAPSQLEFAKRVMEKHGGVFPAWMIVSSLLYCAALAVCIAAIICGIIGVRRIQRRGMAIAALIVSGGMVLFACGNVALSLVMHGKMISH